MCTTLYLVCSGHIQAKSRLLVLNKCKSLYWFERAATDIGEKAAYDPESRVCVMHPWAYPSQKHSTAIYSYEAQFPNSAKSLQFQ